MIRELEVTDIDERYFRLLCQLSGEESAYEWQTAMTFWLKYEDNDLTFNLTELALALEKVIITPYRQ